MNPGHHFIGEELTRPGGFAPKSRWEENRAAVLLLKMLEAEGRAASEEEKRVLCRYNSWGGLAKLFDLSARMEDLDGYRVVSENPWLSAARREIPQLLTEDELAEARRCVNNGHFTSPEIVRQVWRAVCSLGFKGGLILEPACGVGNFLGLTPREIVGRSGFVAVEKDPLTARIARMLYPDAKLHCEGFEDVRLGGVFDLAISNVPFGDFAVYDREYPGLKLPIHDFFIVKALDRLRPGGLGVFLTSASTMDKSGTLARRLMAQKADLLGAVRLPDDAHLAQAGTRVTTDILFLRRLAAPRPASEPDPAWVETGEIEIPRQGIRADWPKVNIGVNNYFLDNPGHVLGAMEMGSGEAGREKMVVVSDSPLGQSLERVLPAVLSGQSLTADVGEKPGPAGDFPPQSQTPVLLEEGERFPAGTIIESSGKLYKVCGEGDQAIEMAVEGKAFRRLLGLIGIREALESVIALEQGTDGADVSLSTAREALNSAYDGFVAEFGPLNRPVNRRPFEEDPHCGRVMALEVYNDEADTAEKADIFRQRVISMPAWLHTADTPQEALAIVLDRRGAVDIQEIAELCGLSESSAAEHLVADGQIYLDPGTRTYISAAQYLSGNLRVKLEQAETAAVLDPSFQRNASALREALPPDLGPQDIEVRLGAPWIPENVVAAFASKALNVGEHHVSVVHRRLNGQWIVDISKGYLGGVADVSVYGTPRRPFHELLNLALNGQSVAVYDTVLTADGVQRRVLNEADTYAAQEKLDYIQQHFRSFIWNDEERAEDLVRIYNDTFNSFVPPNYDGSHLTFPGMSATMRPRPCQANAVWRALVSGENVLLAHEVGVGKTLEQVAIAMEWKRLGRASKPLWIVPNHMLEQAEREARQLYPGAAILALGKKHLDKKDRAFFLGRISNNNWDLIITTHRVFGRISVNPAFEKAFTRRELEDYKAELLMADARDTGSRRRLGVKRLEARIKSLEARLKKMSDLKRDDGIYLDDLGVDALLVDESHNFKNLAVTTSNSEANLGIQGSARAWDLYMKTRWLFDKRGGESGVVFASGTPVSNDVLEIYNNQRYLQPSTLAQACLSAPSSWAGSFLQPKTAWEPSPSGTGWRLRTRYALQNIPELIRMLRVNMDVATAEDAGIKRPERLSRNILVEMSPFQQRLMRSLARRVRAIHERKVTPEVDNLLKIVAEGRMISQDPRLLYPGAPGLPSGKAAACAREAHALWLSSASVRGTQMIFCDIGTPSSRRDSFNLYDDIKARLVALGVPGGEIAFIHDYPTDEAKAALFQKFREGEVRFLLGSTTKMGEGTNAQDRIVGLHHFDPPWRPSDIDQRDGRGIRFGNLNDTVARFIYTTKDSFDLFMWATLEHKAKTFARVLKGDPSVRVLDLAVDPTYAETAAITSGNPLIREKLEIDQEVSRLQALQKSQIGELFALRKMVVGLKEKLQGLERTLKEWMQLPNPPGSPDEWSFDQRLFGKQKEIRGERDAVLQKIRDVMVAQGLTSISDGILCGGVPVRVDLAIRAQDGHRETTWSVVESGGDLAWARAADLQDALAYKDARIAGIRKTMTETADRIEEFSRVTEEKPFAEEGRLLECLARKRDIERRIEEQKDADATLEDGDACDLIADAWAEEIQDAVEGEVEDETEPVAASA